MRIPLLALMITSGVLFGIYLPPADAQSGVAVSVAPDSSRPGCEFDDRCYVPTSITIRAGDVVTWTNDDAIVHTVSEYDGDLFDSGIMQPEDVFEFTFDKPGTYDYFCLLHPHMVGQVTVRDATEAKSQGSSVPKPEFVIVGSEPDTTDSGCLVATAAFGTELAPQVQLLREIRDDILYSTASGTAFMTGFNHLYYSFSPTVADWQRQNPTLKEAVKMAITPMIYTLDIMGLADQDSEIEVLGYGILLIALNLAVYAGIPAGATFAARRRFLTG